MIDQVQQTESLVNRSRRTLAQAENSGIPEAIRDAQAMLARAIQLRAAVAQEQYGRRLPSQFLHAL